MTVDEIARELLRTSPLRYVTVNPHALAQTEERLFPASKNRSRRIHKKLVKRYGGEYRMRPAAFSTPAGLIVHPEIYMRLRTLQMRARTEDLWFQTYIGRRPLST